MAAPRRRQAAQQLSAGTPAKVVKKRPMFTTSKVVGEVGWWLQVAQIRHRDLLWIVLITLEQIAAPLRQSFLAPDLAR